MSRYETSCTGQVQGPQKVPPLARAMKDQCDRIRTMWCETTFIRHVYDMRYSIDNSVDWHDDDASLLYLPVLKQWTIWHEHEMI